jgi:hypothetical protein
MAFLGVLARSGDLGERVVQPAGQRGDLFGLFLRTRTAGQTLSFRGQLELAQRGRVVWDDATLSEQAAARGRTKAPDSTCAPLDDPDIIPFPADRITRT